MADNTIINVATTTGDTISTEDVSGIKIARSKIAIGSHGVDGGDVTPSNPFPISMATDLDKQNDGIRAYMALNGLVDSSGSILNIQFYVGQPSSIGVNNLIGPQGVGIRVYILSYCLQTTGSVNANLQDTSAVVLTPTWVLSTSGMITIQRTAPSGQYLSVTTANKGVDLNLSAAVGVNVEMQYVVAS